MSQLDERIDLMVKDLDQFLLVMAREQMKKDRRNSIRFFRWNPELNWIRLQLILAGGRDRIISLERFKRDYVEPVLMRKYGKYYEKP